MHDPEFTLTATGCIGILPDGTEMEFATQDEYMERYREDENEIYDEMAEAFDHPEFPEYPEDWF